MKRLGVDPSTVSAVLVSHLHGDHFGGIPFDHVDAARAAGFECADDGMLVRL